MDHVAELFTQETTGAGRVRERTHTRILIEQLGDVNEDSISLSLAPHTDNVVQT